jgi:serine/threonine-protein kinase HipA
MKQAQVYVSNVLAGHLTEDNNRFTFEYVEDYDGQPVSLTMPVSKRNFTFENFPPFFDGLLPEGQQLEGLLRQKKLDRSDYFSQIVAVGNDLVGAVTVKLIA